MPEVKRQTAYKCSIKMILEGNYVQRPGWDPNYIQINGIQISRVNILAVIVNKEGNTFTMDDGTSQIQIMFFGEQNKFENVAVGNIIRVIGRPREYNQKRFIVPEIIKIVEDSKWIDYRKLELIIQENEAPIKTQTTPIVQEQIEQKSPKTNSTSSDEEIDNSEPEVQSEEFESGQRFEDNYASKIISTIRALDKGDGANINDVIKKSGLEKAEKYIISLINEGEIFEIRTGKIKILE